MTRLTTLYDRLMYRLNNPLGRLLYRPEREHFADLAVIATTEGDPAAVTALAVEMERYEREGTVEFESPSRRDLGRAPGGGAGKA